MNTVEVASWKVRRAAYVRPSNSTDGCPCTVRFLYSASGELTRASILLQYATAFAGTDNTTQDIILFISPENTRSCRLALSSEDYLVPPLVLPHIPTTAVCGPSDVLTLTLTLKTLGVVLHPPNISSFHPASDADEASFEAFVKICQATDIQLHFARAQFGLVGAQKSDRMQLRQFVGDFNTSQTEPAEFDLTSANSGRGLTEGTWRVFQPCSAAILPTTGVLGKRRRAASDVMPNPLLLCFEDCSNTPPPYSPTEIMTPSPTYAPSLQASSLSSSLHNIRPTQIKTGRLRSGIPRDLSPGLEQFASQVGSSVKKDLQPAIVSPSHGSACTEIRQLVSNAPQRGSEISSPWDNKESFGKQLQEMLSATVEARLEGLVQQMVPQLANKAFIEVLGSYWDAFHQSCETAEDNIQNQVDEGRTEIKSITNDGVEELEKCGRKYLSMLKSRGNKLCELVETETQEFVDIAEQESDKLSKLIESHKTSLQHPKRSQDGAGKRCVSV